MSRRRYPVQVELFEQGSPVDVVHLVDRGLLKLARVDKDGRNMMVAWRGSGSILSAQAAILKHPHVYSAIAVTPVVIYELRTATFLNLLDGNPALSGLVHQLHSRDLDDFLLRLTDLYTLKARYRLEQALWQISASSNGVQTQEIPLKFSDLADAIGVTPVHLSRLLKKVESDGMIRRSQRRLIVTDRDRLWHQDLQGLEPPRHTAFP